MQNTRRKIELRPYWYKNSKDQERLTLSIDVSLKENGDRDWKKSKEKSFSLSAEAVEVFYQEISKFLKLVGKETSQDFVVAEVSNVESLKSYSPSSLLNAVGKLLNTENEQFKTFDVEHDLVPALQNHLRFNSLSHAIKELTKLIDDPNTSETPLQRWLEDNFWVFGNSYVAREEIRSVSPNDNVDMLLKKTANGLRDIVEVKTAKPRVLIDDKGRNQLNFSSDVSAAIGQCARYLEVFSDQAGRGLLDHDHIVARQPKAIIIIGRSENWGNREHKALHRLNSRLYGIQVKTYDEIILEAQCLLNSIRTSSPDNLEIDEIPF